MIAADAAAEAVAIERGYPLTDEELKQLRYVEEEGGTWTLPIPDSVINALYEEEQNKNA